MFEKPTVIIVGAGGSAEFGLPTGEKILSDLLAEPTKSRSRNYNIYTDLFESDFCSFLEFNKLKFQQSTVEILTEKASGSYAPSIDLFAYNNKDILDISKLYSSWKILAGLCTTHKINNGTFMEPSHVGPTYSWRRPRINNTTTWLAHLARKITEGYEKPNDLQENNLKIITFNYDTIIEDAIRHLVRSEQRYAEADDDVFPKVYHVFGKFPDLHSKMNSQDIVSASKYIKYMYEIDESDSENVNLLNIRNAIKKAVYIYILGFDMHEKNVRLIGLKDCSAKKFALNYDGHPRLQSSLLNINIEAGHIMSGSDTNKMTAGKACESGFFDLSDLYPIANPQMFFTG